jgi:ketosteroid isomerase-like protein
MLRRAGVRGFVARAICLLAIVAIFSRACDTAGFARPVVPPVASSFDIVSVQRAIDSGNRAYVAALVRKDAIAFGNVFALDAVSLPSTAPAIHGRDAIVASITAVFARMTFVRGTIRTLETHLEGQTATEIGAYSFDVVVDGNERTLAGRYLVIWRDVGGLWKIAVDSSQPEAPAG